MATLPTGLVYIAMSLDGFIAAKDGDLSWLEVVKAEGEDYGYAAFMASIDAILIGRNTYDTVPTFGAWPFEGKRVVVLTHRPIAPIREETAASGKLLPIFDSLGAEGVKRIYLDGGKTIQAALREGLVQELTISVIPILLGEGIPLFDAHGPKVELECLGAKTFPSGLAQLRYRRKS
jgi:dihydrofolate reductase